ncbi:uncharacterized protein METZ01_LOCUS260723, partial [marine metagenome]
MERSLENFPIFATLMMDFLVHDST